MKGVKGVVIDGGCRDLAEHREMGFPVCPSVYFLLDRSLIVRSLPDITPRWVKAHMSVQLN